MVVAAAVGTAVAIAIGTWFVRRTHSPESPELRVTPLTANTGIELHPSFSPDGTRVAYSSSADNGRHFGVYVKLIGPGDPVPVTKGVDRDFSPAWSPDGRWIAVLRDMGHEGAVLLIPASGGQSRELTRVIKTRSGDENCGMITAICGVPFRGSLLAWSVDGKFLFTSGRTTPELPMTIMRISVDTGEQQSVTSPSRDLAGDVGPAMSPDGRSLAFVRLKGSGIGDIYMASLSGEPPAAGHASQVTTEEADLSTPAWTPDGRELIFSSNRTGWRELWRVKAAPSPQPVRLAGVGENASDVAISPLGRHLVYGRVADNGTLWKIPINAGKGGKPVLVTATTARLTYPDYSPDGKRLAFQSARSGVNELWLCDADGSNSAQLTSFGSGASGMPRWSPDGHTIAFDRNLSGNWDVYTIRSDGGRPVRLTTDRANDVNPNWSRDGRWIYFFLAAHRPPRDLEDSRGWHRWRRR